MGVNWHTKHMCYSGQLATKWRCVYVKRDDPQHSHSQSMSVARGCSSTKEKCGRRSVMGPISQLMITYGGYNILEPWWAHPQKQTYSHLNRKGSVAFTSQIGIVTSSLAVCRFVCWYLRCAKEIVKSIHWVHDVEQSEVSVDVPDLLDRCPKGSTYLDAPYFAKLDLWCRYIELVWWVKNNKHNLQTPPCIYKWQLNPLSMVAWRHGLPGNLFSNIFVDRQSNLRASNLEQRAGIDTNWQICSLFHGMFSVRHLCSSQSFQVLHLHKVHQNHYQGQSCRTSPTRGTYKYVVWWWWW